ncbi:MAG: homoserine kinase [Actinomycetota bacterium]|nr:homoserine kinase [Actinomycetota bacterium]
MRLTVRVPATAANLGPGFDCFGLALDLCNEVTIDTDARPGVSWEGEGAGELPTDGSDLVSRAVAATVEKQSRHHRGAAIPRFAMHGVNRIPLERGLGSSSAAAVAGVAIAALLLGRAGFDPADPRMAYTTYAYAAALEGHPDNAAPAAFGGLTVIADGYVARMEPHPALRPVALIPEVRLSTARARQAVPDHVSRSDAVYNVAHGALTVHALTQDPDLLQVALHDRLHQEARLELVPVVREVFHDLGGRGIPVCVSGSGPSLLAFESDRRPVPDPGKGWTLLRPGVRATGVEVIPD